MDDSEPWRNKEMVKAIALLDLVLASVLIILYLFYGILFMAGPQNFPGGFPTASAVFLSFLFALLAICVNILQAFIAAKLFQALKSEEPDSQDCIRKSRHWLKAAVFFIILVVIKSFILVLIPLGSSNAFDFVLCAWEALLRVVGLYAVKELIDDLRAESARGMPRSISVIVMSDLLQKAHAQEAVEN